MRTWKLTSIIVLLSAGILLTSTTSYAQGNIHWFASLNVGAALAKLPAASQEIQTQSTTSNTYIHDPQTQINAIAGAFVGLDFPLSPLLNYEVGLNYNYIQPYSIDGQLQQFSEQQFTNFNYQYNVQSHQLLVESKLLFNLQHHLHPYLSFGLGSAMNSAYDFSATAIYPTDAYPGIFADHTTTTFAYHLGLGFDADVLKHLRVGIGYRYASLGKANLGAAPDFASNQALSTTLNASQLLATMTYLF